MRDLLLLGIVIGALPFALRFTWVAVLLWTWISIMNPHKLAFGFATHAPFAAVAAGAALISILYSRDRLKWTFTPPVVALILFVLWMCITTALAFYPAQSWAQLNKILKIQLMTLVARLRRIKSEGCGDAHPQCKQDQGNDRGGERPFESVPRIQY